MSNNIIETLERRRLLSISFAANLLRINGTSSDDFVSVSLDESGTRIVAQLNTSFRRFNFVAVAAIVIVGNAGNVRLSIASDIQTPSCLDGRAANDRLGGGASPDRLYGGK